MSEPINTIAPLTYPTWLKYQANLSPDIATNLYVQYLNDWYKNNTLLTISDKDAIKRDYIQLLKDLSFLFGKEEKDLFLSQLDYTNDEEIILAIPYFVQKLKDISKVFSYKRESVKNSKIKYSLVGSQGGLETLLYEYVLKNFTLDPNNITQVPISSLSSIFPQLSSVSGNFFIEVEELHDSNSYHDSDPSVSVNQYLNVNDLENYAPIENTSEEDLLKLISSRFLSKVADTPLSRLFNQYLLEVPTLSTAALLNDQTTSIYNQIAASQKYLGETVYGLTAVRLSEIDTPDYVLNVRFDTGNNWFYWPSGDKVTNEFEYNNTYAPILINNSNFVKSGAAGGSSYLDSDLIFTNQSGIVEGAWLQGPRTTRTTGKMEVNINAGTYREFIFPYVGFKINSKGTYFESHSLTDSDYSIYQKLVPEQQISILRDYYTTSLPNSSCDSIYLNDTNLVYSGAYAELFSDEADSIMVRDTYKGINEIYNDNLKGVSQEAYLYKFLKTDFPIKTGTNDIVWPIGTFGSDENVPITVKEDTCTPIILGEVNPSKTMPGAVAGSDMNDSDLIFKLNTRTEQPLEAAWLGSGSIASLDTGSDRYPSIPVYDTNATFCASYVNGNVQGALSTRIESSNFISFVWMDEDTYADDVLFFRSHAEDCPYHREGAHDYYKNQDYRNPTPINNSSSPWEKCRCKSLYWSPIGHAGRKVTDYNGMADYLFADPQGLGSDFAFNSWLDTRGYGVLQSPQFSFYRLDQKHGDRGVGWGSGSWRTGNGSKMVLKTGRRYTYYRTSLKLDTTETTVPPLVVNYPYKNIRGIYSSETGPQDIVVLVDTSTSERNNIYDNITAVREFVNQMIEKSDADVQISIVTFDKYAQIKSYLTSDINVLNLAISNISTSIDTLTVTDIYEGLKYGNYILTTNINNNPKNSQFKAYSLCNALKDLINQQATKTTPLNLVRKDAKKTIILFSDGNETQNIDKALPYSRGIKAKGINIFSIATGPNTYYTDLMQKIASEKQYFNLQKYLLNSDGDLTSFIQYLVSYFSGTLSIIPTWYKAIRDNSGNWVGTSEISDMVLLPGDNLVYVHRSGTTSETQVGTSFSTPSITFPINIPLKGWDYTTNTVSITSNYCTQGAKPFWGKVYTSAEKNKDVHFDKQIMSFGGQVRFIDDYLPIHQPEISPIVLANGNFVQYTRKSNDNMKWKETINFTVSLSSYQWNKITFYKDYSNLNDIFRNGNPLDLIAFSTDEPSDLVLQSYNSFIPSRYNYYAVSAFNYSENLFYKNRCLSSFVQFATGIAVEASSPHANLLNVHFPTVATVSFPSMAKTDKEIGEYLLPEKLGVSYYRGRGYTMDVDGDTLSFIDGISAERLFLNTDKYGPRSRGLTKNDQYSPVSIKEIDSRWMIEPFSSSDSSGTIVDVLNNQKFTPYQTKYEITKKNPLGVSRQDDDFSFWNIPPLFGNWDSKDKYPVTFRNELLASSYDERKKELLVNKGDLDQWRVDVYGNDYGLFKTPLSSFSVKNPTLVKFSKQNTVNTPVDLGCGVTGYKSTIINTSYVSVQSSTNVTTQYTGTNNFLVLPPPTTRVYDVYPKYEYVFDADFLVFRYKFDDGRDLDTRTSLVLPEAGSIVGWCKGSSYVGSNSLEWYRWGGDNTGTGYEAVVIYLNNITSSYPKSTIEGISNAFWYGTRVSGNVRLELAAYKGGIMRNISNDWVNEGGTQTGAITKYANVVTNIGSCVDGELVARWSYNTANKNFSWIV